MRVFHLLSLESKANGNEFIHAVECLASNADIHASRVRYDLTLDMTRLPIYILLQTGASSLPG